MCGIFGFVSEDKHKANEILEGLKLLEYRGYDSWGIAVKLENKISVEKNTGKIGNAKNFSSRQQAWDRSYPLGNSWRSDR